MVCSSDACVDLNVCMLFNTSPEHARYSINANHIRKHVGFLNILQHKRV